MVKPLSVIVVLLPMLWGCATTNQFELAEYDSSPTLRFPPVAVFMTRANEDFVNACETFDAQSFLHHCMLNSVKLESLQSMLGGAGVFEKVSYADRDEPFKLHFSTAVYNQETGGELGQAVIAGATLLLAPMIIEATVKSEVSLTWGGTLIDRFDYELPFEARSSLLSLDQNHAMDLARLIGSHVIRDLQAGDYFSARAVAQSLEATNYQDVLSPPLTLYSLEQSGMFIAHHPFTGAQVRYIHPVDQQSYVDVFVYPVRAWRWNDAQALLELEIEGVQRDIELALTEMASTDLVFDPPGMQRVAKAQTGIYLGARYRDPLENHWQTNTFVTIVNDKFVKLRHSALIDAEAVPLATLMAELLAGMEIPGESPFMARVRKNWRDSGELQQ